MNYHTTPAATYHALAGDVDDLCNGLTSGGHCVNENISVRILRSGDSQRLNAKVPLDHDVHIYILKSGTLKRKMGDRIELVSSSQIHITRYIHNAVTESAGVGLRGICISVKRKYILDYFKLDLSHVPNQYQPIFTSRFGAPTTLTIPMAVANVIALEQLISCTFSGPLRAIFVGAKTLEIVCDLVARINGLANGTFKNPSSRKRFDEAVESAAAIYRREVRKPPTIDQLGSRVGLNRNDLTNGFKERFGVTPHAFSRQVRMDYAFELLSNRDLSISEVARRVGYGSYASFTRAFEDYFHRPLRSSTFKAERSINDKRNSSKEHSDQHGVVRSIVVPRPVFPKVDEI